MISDTRRITFLSVVLSLLIINSSPLQADVDLDTGIRFFKLKQYEKSRDVLENVLEKQSDNPTAHYYLGRTYFNLDDYAKAVVHFKKAVKLQPARANYHFWLGRGYGAEATHAGAFKQALLAPKVKKAFERAVEIDPGHVQARIGLANFYLRAPRIMGGNIDQAYTHARILVGLQEVVQGRLLLARIYEKDKKLAAAELEYQYLEQQYGTSSERHTIYDDYGNFLIRQERYDDAIDKFTRQAVLDPDNPRVYDRLGDAYRAAGRWSKAAEAYRRALYIDPYLKTVQHKLKETEKALNGALEYP